MPNTDTTTIKKIPLYLGLLFCLSFAQNLNATTPLIDSLLALVATTPKNTTYVDIHNELAFQYLSDNISKAPDHINEACKTAITLGYKRGLADCQARNGSLAEAEGDFDKAIEFYNDALEYRIKLRNPIPAANIYNNIGICLFFLDKDQEAIDIYKLGLAIISKQPKSTTHAQLTENLAEVYSYTGDYTLAFINLQTSYTIWESLKHTLGMAGNLNAQANLNLELMDLNDANINFKKSQALYKEIDHKEGIATTYIGLGNVAFEYTDYKEALVHYDRAEKYSVAVRDLNSDLLNFNKGIIARNLNDLDLALNYFQQCKLAFEEVQDECNLASTLAEIGVVYKLKNELTRAKEYLLNGLKYCEDERDLFDKSQNYLELAAIYAAENQDKLALEYNNNYQRLRDSIYNSREATYNFQVDLEESKRKEAETARELSDFKTEIFEQQAKEERREKIMILIIALLLISLLAFFLDRSRKKSKIALYKTEQAYMEIDDLLLTRELEITQARLNATDETQRQIGQDLHDRLGVMLSTIKLYFTDVNSNLETIKTDTSSAKNNQTKAIELLDEAVAEVRRISKNIQSGVLKDLGLVSAVNDLASTIKESKQLNVEVNSHGLQQRIPNDLEFKIYKIIQELIGNVLKHSKAKNLTIYLYQQNDLFNLIVEDDGIGFDQEKVMDKGGMGLKNIALRTAELNGKCHFDSSLGKGTSVIIDIPTKTT